MFTVFLFCTLDDIGIAQLLLFSVMVMVSAGTGTPLGIVEFKNLFSLRTNIETYFISVIPDASGKISII